MNALTQELMQRAPAPEGEVPAQKPLGFGFRDQMQSRNTGINGGMPMGMPLSGPPPASPPLSGPPPNVMPPAGPPMGMPRGLPQPTGMPEWLRKFGQSRGMPNRPTNLPPGLFQGRRRSGPTF